MNKEQILARRMLAMRENGYSIIHLLRRSLKVYVILLSGLVAAAAGYFTVAKTPTEKSLCLFAAGLLVGTIVRDLRWLRAIKTQWPFTNRITNWSEVERIASQRTA